MQSSLFSSQLDHIAILSSSDILDRILSGQKTIESRWYVTRRDPWNHINPGDTVYFKVTGQPITARATVDQVLQFGELNPTKIKEILAIHGRAIGFNKSECDIWAASKSKVKYCILIYLKDVASLKPFKINKKGFGISCAWLTLPNINNIKLIIP